MVLHCSTYKTRKNFINLCYKRDDSGTANEWHFFAASHRKGACDGIWVTIKMLARQASLKRPYEEQIMTIRHLHERAVVKIPSVTFEYCAPDDHSKDTIMLKEKFRKMILNLIFF
jgi:hypothetical protein